MGLPRQRKTRCTAYWLALLALLALPLHPVYPAEPTVLFDTDGYRIAEFLAPVPATAPGAATVTTQEVQALRDRGDSILIDVLPAPPRPAGLGSTDLWLPPPHRNIPGSVWLPNVGYGRLSDALSDYLRRTLQKLTGGDLHRPLVIYCRADCWMSWNLAKRLAADGYRRVYWYPEGTNGWEAIGLPLEASRPATTD